MLQQHVLLGDAADEVGGLGGLGGGEVGVGPGDEGGVVQVGPVDVGDLVETAQVERGGEAVDLVLGDPELAGEQLHDVVVEVLLDLQAHRRAEAASGQLPLEGGEQVLGVVLLDLEVLVAGDPEGVVLVDLHAREELVEVGGDDVLERDEAGLEEVGGHRRRARRTLRKRGSEGGILMRAKCSLPVLGLMRITARLSESPEMYGKGCAGSTASGVSTG